MRSIWSKIGNSRTSTFVRKKPELTKVRLGLELLEDRITPTTTVALDPAGNLTVIDGPGTGNDNITIKSNVAASQFEINHPGNVINTSIAGASGSGTSDVSIPFSSVIGSAIVVNTLSGDDFLTLDFSAGNFSKTVTYDGGVNTAGIGDELRLQGGGVFANVTHTHASASSGSVSVTGNALISYIGLEPITDNLSATDRVFRFTGGSESIVVDDVLGGPAMVVDSSLGEFVTFNPPTNSLTIDAGTGIDSINVAGYDSSFAASLILDGGTGDDTFNIRPVNSAFNGSLIIHGGTGHDTVNFFNDMTFAANRILDVNLEDDPTPVGVDRIIVAANANYVLSGTGTATMKASAGISFAVGSSLITANGALTLEGNGPGIGDSSFVGITVDGAIVQSTGSGAVQILGRGGVGTVNNFGVLVAANGAAPGIIQSGTGPLQVLGTGGANTTGVHPGVYVTGNGSRIGSAGGNVRVTGEGGAGNSPSNNGVNVEVGAQISAGGAGTVTVTGTAGTGGGPNVGVRVTAGGLITSSSGNVQVTGVGRASPFTNGNNHGVLVSNGGQISAGGVGTVTVHGTASLAGGIDNHGVFVTGSGALITSNGGNIQVTGIQGAAGPSTPSFGINLTSFGGVGYPGLANVELISDSMNFDSTAVITGGLNTVTLRQRTAGTAINLGAADSAGVLGLTDGELDRVTAATINIGDLNSGTMTLSATVSRGPQTILNLTTGGNIDMTFGTNNLLDVTNGMVTLNSPNGSITTPPGPSGISAFFPDVVANNTSVDGIVAPGGSSAGEFAVVGGLEFSSTDRYRAQLNGGVLATQYDLISIVNGRPTLGSATLEVVPGFTPSIGQQFVIINTTNSSSPGGPIGTFRDTLGNTLNEGSTFTASGVTFRISYAGGTDGKDVVLTAVTAGLTIAISDASVVETNAGTTTITFNVTLSAPGTQTIAVNWATANGTATTADNDYGGASGTVSFGIGETSKPVTITVNGDTKFELNETFVVNLSNAVGAIIGDNQGVGTITNDDAPPTVTLSLAGSPLAENGGVATVTATLSAVSGQTVTVNLGFTGTATNPADYTRSGTSIVIAAGSTTGSITLTGVDDPTDEVNETVIVDITTVTNGAESGTQQVTATITDDDLPRLTLSIAKDWSFQTVDAAGDVGAWSSLQIGTDNRPRIAYEDRTTNSRNLKYASFDGAVWSVQTVHDDPTDIVGQEASLVLDSLNRPHIAYQNFSDIQLLYAHHNGTAWVLETANANSYLQNSIDVDSLNRPLISSFNSNTFDLNLARRSVGGTWSVESPATAGPTGFYTSLAVDAADNPWIAFVDGFSGPTQTLRLARHDGTAWQFQTIDSGTDADFRDTSLVLDSMGRPHVSYYDFGVNGVRTDLKYAFFNGTSWTITTVDANNAGEHNSLALDSLGRPRIAYIGSGAARFASFDGNAWTTQFVGGPANYTSLALDQNDLASISYYSTTSNDLMLASQITGAMSENGGTKLATVSRTDTAGALTVNLLSNDTTEATVVASVMLADGQATSAPFTINAVDDSIVDGTQTVIISASAAGYIGDTDTVNVTDDDTAAAPTVTLSLAGSPLAEDGGVATVTATLSAASSQTVTVSLGFTGTATHPADYARTGTSITISAGATTGSITLTGVNDPTDEANETIIVDITGVTNGTEAGTQQVTAIITDDDPPPSLSINDVTVTEGNAGSVSATFTISLSAASGQTVTVNAATANNSAVAPGDYTAVPATPVSFAPGQTAQTFTVQVQGDVLDEINETFFVNLSGAVNASIADGQGIGTITDDDAAPSLSINDVTVTEGNAGSVSATFTISLSQASGQTVTVNAATANNSAAAPGDYTAVPATPVSFAPGLTAQTFTVQVQGDLLDEINETFFVNLSGAVNATIADGQGVGTITDDDGAPTVTLSISGNTIDQSVTSPQFQVRNTSSSSNTPVGQEFRPSLSSLNFVEVLLSDAGSDIGPGADFLVNIRVATITGSILGTSPTVHVADGTNTGGGSTYTRFNFASSIALTPGATYVIEVSQVGTIVPGNFNFGWVGTNPNGTDMYPAGRAIISGSPVTNAYDFLFREGIASAPGAAAPLPENGGGASVTATLSEVSAQDVTVNLGFGGTATNVNDYTRSGTSITIPAGQMSGSITLTSVNDTLDEPDESIIVDITTVTNGSESGTQQVTATITDDDAPPSLSINDVTATEGNAGSVSATFTISLSAASGQTVTVNAATANNSAVAPGDYTAVPATPVSFAPGQTSQTFTVQVQGDLLDEINETFFVNLSGAVNASIADGQGIGTITDDDAAPSLSINDVTVTEGNAGTTSATFTVSLSQASGQTVTVNFTTADGSATLSDSDYQNSSGTLTFTPGQTTQTVTVVVNGDTKFESNETFAVNLSGATNATIADITGLGTIQNDDTQPTISINDVSLPEGNTGTTNFIFTVSLSNPSSLPITVNFATADGTATVADNDYDGNTGSLTFNPGQTSRTITVAITSESKFEPDETFTVTLSGATNASIADAAGVGTIVNDDSQPTISITDVSQSEGNAGTTSFSFTVLLSNPTSQIVTVNFATADGTATLVDGDYVGNSGTLTFTPPVRSHTITVLVNGDTKFEAPSEAFFVNLSGATNAAILDGQGQGTIVNDDNGPAISINDVSMSEGNAGTTSFVFTVSLSNASSQPVTINYATADVSATLADNDYQPTSGTLTFAPGQTSQTVTVLANGDTKFEPNETFRVQLSNASGAGILDGIGVGTIQNDDSQPTISIDDAIATIEGNSGTTSVVFTVRLSNPTSQVVTVNFTTADGTATVADSDYVANSGALTFPAGVGSQTITVVINGDTKFEPSESFFVDLTSASNASILDSQGAGTIDNDDTLPAISINDVALLEGNAGTTNFVFTVSLSNASWQTVNVTYATANGTATTADGDYQPNGAILSFAPGQTSQTVTVLVNGDTKFEPDETFSVNLSNEGNATIADGTGLGTIRNDDNPPTISISDVALAEGNSGVTTFVFTVSLSNPSSQTVTVNYATSNGTALASDDDYQGASGTVTFAPGQTTQPISVLVVGDPRFEFNETFSVNLSGAVNASIADASGLGTIVNDDPRPTISIDDISLLEGNTGSTSFVFTVRLSGLSPEPISVNFATADGSATTADGDYQPAAGVLNFAPGDASKTITVPVGGDTKFEPNESFTVNLSGATNATIADGTGLGNIVNDDGQPTISINDVSLPEGNSGTTAFVFTVTLSNASAQAISVNFATADGSATVADNDYQNGAGSVTFAPGQTSQTVTVLVGSDTKFEPDETFAVTLSGAANATIADGAGLGTIRNDDGQPTISINDVSLPEGNSGTTAFVFTVALSNASAQAISVNFATANGSATLTDNDYQSASGTLTFAPGQTSQTVSVLVNADTTVEPDETFSVNLSGATNASLADPAGLGTIRNDDGQPTISINDVSLLEGNSGTTAFTFTVSLSNASAQAIIVNFATANSSATLADNDYQSNAGSVTFAPGTTSQSITVLVDGDTKFEPDETFAVNLGAATNATIADGTGLGTIRNDDNQPTLSINDVSLLEGNSGTTAFVFTVSLSNASAQAITANFATADGSATLADSDYQSNAGSVTFAPGTTSQSITVLVNGDTKFEPDETFTVNLSGATNATLADSAGLGTIRNDDGQPTISINDVSLLEGNSGTTAFIFTVGLSNASAQAISVNFATANSSATLADNDYQSNSGSVTFAPGTTSQSITVLVNGDAKFEPDETFTVNLSAATNATIADGTGLGTIRNDDGQPTISINDVSLLEGNSGTTAFVFTVSLSNASAQAITANFATADGSATLADSDYPGGAGSVTFAPGTTSQSVTVLVNGDTKFEPDETFTVNLSGATNATIADGAGLGTIRNDDGQPTISINDVSLGEGNSGTTAYVFTVSLSNASSQTIAVTYATANGSATLADGDYQSAGGALTFGPGQTSQTVTVLVNGDTKFEPNESFLVNLSAASNATILDGQGQGTIVNDDAQPAVSIDDVTHLEGNAGTTAYVFTLTLSNASSLPVTVGYATANGSATTADSDYQAASGTATFAAGQTTQSITVLVNGDTKFETDETFVVNLTTASNATIADSQGVGAIRNDDARPTISISDVTMAEGDAGDRTFVFTVSLSNPSAEIVTVNYATSDGTAQDGGTGEDNDYALSAGAVIFAETQTTQTIVVQVHGDLAIEADETFFVNLSAAQNATILDGQGRGAIVNDDADNSGDGTVELVGGVLTILGTDADDHVHVNRVGSGNNAEIRVHASFLDGKSHYSFAESSVTQIVIMLRNGDDHATVADNVTVSVFMDGEAGNDRLNAGGGNALIRGGVGDDTLQGGSGNDILVGGEGDDVLVGGSGRDLLIGGVGSDQLAGSDGDDILIAGFTDHDAVDSALLDIIKEWTSSHTFQQRVNNLTNGTGGGAGGPKNGATFLNALTVHDDGADDDLTGGNGDDWLL